jgi:uncharacterized membrane protein
MKRRDFTVPALLVALSLVPTLGGVVRTMSVAGDTVTTPENARFLQAPAPIVLHLVAATTYSLLGAFQFSRGVRARWPTWHRHAGRVLALCGLLAGATGVWMTATYDIPVGMQGPLLYWVRLVVGTAMVTAIGLGVTSILRRDVKRHEAFMIRAYALGQGAGTQALVLGPWTLLTGESTGFTRDALMAVAWGINVVVGEWVIGRRPSVSSRRS